MEFSILLCLVALKFFGTYNTVFGKFVHPDEIANKKYDYIVVGAGAAGCALTRKLLNLKPQPSVLLLEAGGKPPDITKIPLIGYFMAIQREDIDWNYQVERTNNWTFLSSLSSKTFTYSAGRVLGGGTSINGLAYKRGTKESYDRWERDYGATGWNWNNVLKVFIEDENNDDYRLSNTYHGRSGLLSVSKPSVISPFRETWIEAFNEYGTPYRDVQNGNSTGIYDMLAMIGNGQRCSSYTAFIKPIEYDCNQKLFITLNVMVQKVLLKKQFQKTKSYGVEFIDEYGKTYKVFSRKEVILSAGTVRSPQILMLSGIGPTNELKKYGIKQLVNLPVGENFQDDAQVTVLYLSCNNCTIDGSDMVGLSQWYKTETGIFTDSSAGNLPVGFVKSPYSKIDPDIEIILYNIVNQKYSNETGTDQLSKYYEAAAEKQLVSFSIQNMLANSRGRVTLNSSDIRDQPIIAGHYFDDKDQIDFKRLLFGLKWMVNFIKNSKTLRKANVALFDQPVPFCKEFKIWSDPYLECVVQYMATVGLHMTGTVRMGAKERNDTVVDPTLKVKGVDGLRVADCSIMPSKPHGHTTAPAIMVGSMCAKFIALEHR